MQNRSKNSFLVNLTNNMEKNNLQKNTYSLILFISVLYIQSKTMLYVQEHTG